MAILRKIKRCELLAALLLAAGLYLWWGTHNGAVDRGSLQTSLNRLPAGTAAPPASLPARVATASPHLSAPEGVRTLVPGVPGISNQSHVLCHTFYCGRLGNTLFEYVGILGVARATNKSAVFTNPEVLQGVLKNPPEVPPDRLKVRCGKAKVIAGDLRGGQFHPELMKLRADRDYFVKGCMQSRMYFDRMAQEARRVVTFADEVVANATAIIARLRQSLPAGTTLVGVHVRREDLLSKKWVGLGFVAAPPEYFHRAMTQMRQSFAKVVFVVLGQDPLWCATHLRPVDNDTVILQPRSAAEDLQTLALTDHMIMSVGSFSWWAAFKLAGTTPSVLYFKDFAKKGSGIDRWFGHDFKDYMMPHWRPA